MRESSKRTEEQDTRRRGWCGGWADADLDERGDVRPDEAADQGDRIHVGDRLAALLPMASPVLRAMPTMPLMGDPPRPSRRLCRFTRRNGRARRPVTAATMTLLSRAGRTIARPDSCGGRILRAHLPLMRRPSPVVANRFFRRVFPLAGIFPIPPGRGQGGARLTAEGHATGYRAPRSATRGISPSQ